MKRNRRSFLKAALGCVASLAVPGVLLTEKKFVNTVTTLPDVFKITTWYKPGIWAMSTEDAKLIEGAIIVMRENGVVWLKMENGSWKEERFSKRS